MHRSIPPRAPRETMPSDRAVSMSSGAGFFLGAYRIQTALASPGQRAGLIAAIWIVYYLAFSVPVVIAGVATTHFGLHQSAAVYSAVLAALAAAAAGIFLFRRRSQTRGPDPAAQAESDG